MNGGKPLIIVLQVNAPPYMAQGIKEHIAMTLERFGDTKVLEVRMEDQPQQQMQIGGFRNG